MRTASRLLLAVGVLLALPASAHAKTTCMLSRVSGVFETVRAFVQQQIAPGPQRPKPQAVEPAPAGGPSVDLGDLSKPEVVERQLRTAVPTPRSDLKLTVPNGQARLGDFTIGSAETMTGHLLVLGGDANVYGKLLGNLVTMDGNVVMHPGGVVSGDILALHGDVRDQGGEIGGEVRTLSAVTKPPIAPDTASTRSAVMAVGRNVAGVVGVFFTLLALGVGLVTFARPSLDVVSDTASHSFGRSFITGLIGQILVLPTFGMLVVGLVLSVAGILLLPFAVVVFVLLLILGVVRHRLGQQLSVSAHRTGGGVHAVGCLGHFRLGTRGRRDGAGGSGTGDLAGGHSGFRRGAAESGGSPRQLRRSTDPARGSDRRIPLGHAAVRRPSRAAP